MIRIKSFCNSWDYSHSVWFHMWCKENLIKHQKVWKQYDSGCLRIFHFLFTSLLTAPIVKKIYFIFLKSIVKQTSTSFNINIWPPSKNWKKQCPTNFCLTFYQFQHGIVYKSVPYLKNVYIMLIINNCASFHVWWKENNCCSYCTNFKSFFITCNCYRNTA